MNAKDAYDSLENESDVYDWGEYEKKSGRYFLANINTPLGGIVTAFYKDSDILAFTKRIQDGYLHGKAIYFDKNGQIEEKSNWFNGARDGKSTWYYEDVVEERNYEKGVHKEDSTWYFDKNGNAFNGVFKTYYENGKLKQEINIKNGIREGVAGFYYGSGVLKSEKMYKNNLQNGKSKSFFENGKVMGVTKYVNGDGIYQKILNQDGTSRVKTFEDTYANGKIYEQEKFDKNGITIYYVRYYVSGIKAVEEYKKGEKVIVK
ncbi:MAG: hypothetical protein KGV58_00010 [Campylobacteraceae bacterium]|nr:hypothetical protein [Campylobacteraceae bacterium]